MLKAIVLLPFKIIGFILSKPILIVLIVIAVGYFVISGNIAKHSQQELDLPRTYQTVAPAPNIAPQVVQTQTRVYYVSSLTESQQQVILLDWFDYNSKQWQRHSMPLPLDKANIIKIYDREAKA